MPLWAVPSILLGLTQTGFGSCSRAACRSGLGQWSLRRSSTEGIVCSLSYLERIRQIPGELRVDQKIVQLTITESGKPFRDAELFTSRYHELRYIFAAFNSILYLILKETADPGKDLHCRAGRFENTTAEPKNVEDMVIAMHREG